MQLQEAILHRIIKAEKTTGPDTAEVIPRSERLPTDDQLLRTAESVLRIYAKAINGYGTFDSNQVRYQFPVLLHNYVVNDEDFIHFSEETTGLIAEEMKNSYLSNGGYVLFLRYENQGHDWLLVVMLKLKAGTGIDQNTLSFKETLSFDIDHLHEAARIDLEKWQAGTQPYLSFIKKSRGGEDVTKYFRQALGCTEYIDSKHHTGQVMKAVDSFCNDQGWTPEQRNDARRRTYEYCDDKDRKGEEVNLTALSAIIFDQEPIAFSDYIHDKGYEVSETFKPHRNTFIRLHRINAKVGNIKVSFDVDDILQQHVDYDVANNCLIINNIPQDLIDKFNEVKTQ
jgi:nucleoid-associated protein